MAAEGVPDVGATAVRADASGAVPAERARLEAVLKAAQYLAALHPAQDVWDEIGAALLGFFRADVIAVGLRSPGGPPALRRWTAGDAAARAFELEGDMAAAMSEVLDSGFLVTRALSGPAPLQAAFLPVTGQRRVEAALMFAHAGGVPRELLDVYLAVAGLVGTTVGRLAAEQELRTRRGELEQLVRERTDQLERANERLQLEIAERRLAEQVARELAYHDSLTGLPNRRLFADRLEVAVARARRNRERVAVAVLDIDFFKNVNDGHGHAFGDALLQGVAGRLVAALRDQDTVARIGGDEFVAVFGDLTDASAAATLAGKLLDLVREPFRLDGATLHVTASVGVALYPEHGSGEGELLRRADEAMYRIKEQGRDGFLLWAPPSG